MNVLLSSGSDCNHLSLSLCSRVCLTWSDLNVIQIKIIIKEKRGENVLPTTSGYQCRAPALLQCVPERKRRRWLMMEEKVFLPFFFFFCRRCAGAAPGRGLWHREIGGSISVGLLRLEPITIQGAFFFLGPASFVCVCVCGSYNESGGTFHLDGWQHNLVCIVFSSRHFNMWRKKLTGDVFPLIWGNFRAGLFLPLRRAHTPIHSDVSGNFFRREYIPMLFTTFPRIPSVFNGRADERDGKKCENESAPSTYSIPRNI